MYSSLILFQYFEIALLNVILQIYQFPLIQKVVWSFTLN
jgi:hypothetical protein